MCINNIMEINMKNNFIVTHRFIVTLFLLTLLGLTVSCSSERNRGFRQGINASDLKSQLELTNDQTEKVEQIIESFRKEVEELRENSSGDRSEMREKMMTIRNRQNETIEELLNEEQKVVYEEIIKQRQDRNERRRQGEGGDRRNN